MDSALDAVTLSSYSDCVSAWINKQHTVIWIIWTYLCLAATILSLVSLDYGFIALPSTAPLCLPCQPLPVLNPANSLSSGSFWTCMWFIL